MPKYCVNKNLQEDSKHEVHNLDLGNWCLPRPENQHPLGEFVNDLEAINAAREVYLRLVTCDNCLPGYRLKPA